MATAPKPGANADPTMSVSVNGTTYVARPRELNALDDMALRKATGFTVQSLMQSAQEQPGLDVFAAIVWLARRQAGEKSLSFDEVAEGLSYSDDIGIGDDEDDAPEAPGAG